MINGNSSLEQSAINSAVAAGFARVQEQVARAQEVRPRFEPLGYIDFLNLELPEREMLMAPWLPHKGLAMIYAWRGVGKTLLALSCAYAIASGAEILGWKPPRPARVVYIDGKMPARTMQDWLEAIKGVSRRRRRPRTTCAFYQPISKTGSPIFTRSTANALSTRHRR